VLAGTGAEEDELLRVAAHVTRKNSLTKILNESD
jgi:hypothetical protein